MESQNTQNSHGADVLIWLAPMIFAALYALWPTFGLPVFYYVPETRSITLAKPEGVIVMAWFGRVACAGLASAALTFLLARLNPDAPRQLERRAWWLSPAVVIFALLWIVQTEARHWMFH